MNKFSKFEIRRNLRDTHRRPFSARRENPPCAVLMTKEKHCNWPCRVECLDAYIAFPCGAPLSESSDADLVRELRSKPVLDHQTQRFLSASHQPLLHCALLLQSGWRVRAACCSSNIQVPLLICKSSMDNNQQALNCERLPRVSGSLDNAKPRVVQGMRVSPRKSVAYPICFDRKPTQ